MTGQLLPVLFLKYNQQDATLYNILYYCQFNALHVSGGFSTHHQELKNCTHSIGYMSSLLAATASGSSKQAPVDGRKNRLKHVEH